MARHSIFLLSVCFLFLLSINRSLEFDGIGFARNHLKTFGYLPKDYSAVDDTDDKALVSALKAYQTFYGLKVTGRIDPDTLTGMIQPRCGTPDSPSMDPLHNITPQGLWPSSKRSLIFGFNTPVIVPIYTLRTAVLSAFSKWSAVTNFTFHEVPSEPNQDIQIGFYAREHGDRQPFDGPGGILAHASLPTGGKFHFDADDHWSVKPVGFQFDLESVSLHEIGHLLGLGHSSDKSAVMFASFTAGQIKRVLQPDDINAIHGLYPQG